MTFISDEDYKALVGDIFMRHFELEGVSYYVDAATATGYVVHEVKK